MILLALPLLARWLFPAHRETQQAVRVPFFEQVAELSGMKPSSGAVIFTKTTIQKIFTILAWVLVVIALARPQLTEAPITKTLPSRDLMLAVDLSGSMALEDFTGPGGNRTDRLTAVKNVLDEFLTRREGDRVGLIFFGSAAFVQSPFTEDLDTCRFLLDEAQVGMAGPQTMLGDAIGLAITLFERSDLEERVLIILTDGNDTGSRVPPDKAAGIARDNGVIIHTVAVGDPKAAGEEKLDEETLREISSTTGGSYFFAGNQSELEEIYDRLDEMETREMETISHRPRRDLFHWPLGMMLVLGMVYHAAMLTRKSIQKRPGVISTDD